MSDEELQALLDSMRESFEWEAKQITEDLPFCIDPNESA